MVIAKESPMYVNISNAKQRKLLCTNRLPVEVAVGLKEGTVVVLAWKGNPRIQSIGCGPRSEMNSPCETGNSHCF